MADTLEPTRALSAVACGMCVLWFTPLLPRVVVVGGAAQDMYAKGREDLRKLLHVAALNVSQIKHQFAFEVRYGRHRLPSATLLSGYAHTRCSHAPVVHTQLRQVAVPGKKYFFRASDNAELHKWVSALTAILAKVREEKLAAAAAGGEESSGVSDVETVASSSDDEE